MTRGPVRNRNAVPGNRSQFDRFGGMNRGTNRGTNRGATSNPSSSSNRSQFDRFGGADASAYRDHEYSLSAADVKADYAGDMDAIAKQEWIDENRGDGASVIESAGPGTKQYAQSNYGGETGFEGAFNRYAEENGIDAEASMDYLYNISRDDFREFINDPIIRSYYDNSYYANQFGDIYNDDQAFNDMYDTAMRINNVDLIGTDQENMFSNPTNVVNAFGTSPSAISSNIGSLVAYGVTPNDAEGRGVTADDLGITDLGLSEEEQASLYNQIVADQFEQSILGSAMYAPDAIPYVTYDAINELSNSKDTYGAPSEEFVYNNPDNISLVSSSLNNIPSFEQLWIFDPSAYEDTMDSNLSGWGSGFYGLSDLLFGEGGAAYRTGREEEEEE